MSPIVALLFGAACIAGPLYFAHHQATQFPKPPQIVRFQPEFDTLFAPDAVVEVLASGFVWLESPTAFTTGDGGAVILFSDVLDNTIYAWDEVDGVRTWRSPSGRREYDATLGPLLEPGANGLLVAADGSGDLLVCDHGNRRVARLAVVGTTRGFRGGNGAVVTTIANYSVASDGTTPRFNSPNDLVHGESVMCGLGLSFD